MCMSVSDSQLLLSFCVFMCACVGCQYICFFSPLVTFFPFQSVAFLYYSIVTTVPFALVWLLNKRWQMCARDESTSYIFTRNERIRTATEIKYTEIKTKEEKLRVKRKIEGSTSPHPLNKHFTNTFKAIQWVHFPFVHSHNRCIF